MRHIPADWVIVAVLLSPTQMPKISVDVKLEDVAIRIEGKLFQPVADGLASGFYDWLRTSNNEVIGVRMFYPSTHGLSYLQNRKNVTIHSPGGLEAYIYFGLDRVFDQKKSADQDFRFNDLFKSHDGAVVITFVAPDEGLLLATS